MYEWVEVKSSGGVTLSERTEVYTGLYNPQYIGVTINPGTDRDDYTPYIEEIDLKSEASSYSQLKLRIEKPDDPNHANDGKPIYNMKVWGYFWK